MVNSELKNILIDRIRQINDESFLEALKILTDSKIEKEKYQLSDFEKNRINQARQEENYIDHQTAMDEIDKWLEK
ncbi:MAG: hypothetical protein ACFCUU_14730 [Cyclobacteriaceae bacterium]